MITFLRSTAGRIVLLALSLVALALCTHSPAPAAMLPIGIGFLVGTGTNLATDDALKYFVKLGVADDRGTFQSPMQVKEVTFTETGGAATYTGAFRLPAGATIHDIIVNGVALWDNAGAVTLKVGDTDDDGFYTAVDLKATDLLAGESISFALAGGKAGAYIANSQVSPRYSATARTVNAIITTASTGGSAGRTRVTILYSTPQTQDIVAATKV